MSTQCDNKTIALDRDECDLVNNYIRLIFQVVNFVFIVQIIDICGTVSNITNILCFVKQDLRDAVTITLLGLTVSDLLSVVTLIWHNIYLIPWFDESEIHTWSGYTVYLTGSVPHVAFTRVTCCITAVITLERCLCVALPLKVQLIFTPRRAIIILITIYVVILAAYIGPVYYSTRFVMQPHPHKPNTTWLTIAFTEDMPIVEKYAFPINNGLLPFTTFTIISVSTAILVDSLRRKTKWREVSSAPGNSGSISKRDKSVSKMVGLIAVTFIVCYIPICCIVIGVIVVPGFSILGRHKNLNTILVSLSFILESANASCNIFIYYNMSSRFRQAFKQMFSCCGGKDQSK